MSALDKLKEQQASTPPSMNSEQLKRIDETLRVLVGTLTSESDRIKKVEDSQASLMLALTSRPSTSATSLPDSLKSDVKQSDGSSVSASELQAFSMMKQISEKLTTLTSTSEKLAAAVRAKSHVTLNEEKVAAVMSRRVEDHFQKAVQEPVDSIRSDLQGFPRGRRARWAQTSSQRRAQRSRR